MSRRHRPSLLGALLWIGIGVAVLLYNLNVIPNLWSMVSRYWPILLILLGLGKVIDYYRHKEGVSIRAGEIVGIVLLLLIGTAITRVYNSRIGEVFRDIPFTIGGTSVQPGEWLGTSYTYSQEATYPLAAPTPLRFENAYGLVTIGPGSDREVRVQLRKVVFHKEESRAKEIANEIRLEAGPEGRAEVAPGKVEAEPPSAAGTAAFVVRTNRDALSSKDYRFRTDMEIFVPKKSHVLVRNSYGEVRVANLDGKQDLSTTHKPIDVRDCTGEFLVSNRYAESRLTNLTGNVTVDARGRVALESIKGNVDVRDEYSPVEIRDVEGSVKVTNTESSIRIAKVTKPVIIDARGTQVTVEDLSDTLKIATSHRRVRITDAASNVSLESRYASVTMENIKGNLDIDSNSDNLNLDEIQGYVRIKGQGSGVRVNSVKGPVEIQTTLKDAVVNNFENGCKVTNEYADVTLSTGTLGKSEVSVKNRNGAIELFLPEDAGFQIEATAKNGRVNSEFPGLEPTQAAGDTGSLKAKLKSGSPKLLLETEYGNINIRTRGSEGSESSGSEQKKQRRVRVTAELR